MNNSISIIGAGNGGQAFASYLSLQGYSVRIFDVFQNTVNRLNELGGIVLEGNSKYVGFGKIVKASTNIEEIMEGSKIILVILPANYHGEIATKMAPFLKDDQIVILNPHASMGPTEFMKTLNEFRPGFRLVLGCTSSLLFACRAIDIGHVVVFGQKKSVTMAAYPSSDNYILERIFKEIIPEFEVVDDVIRLSLDNINAFVHPAPTILNTGRIEGNIPFEYYQDCTPAQGRYIDALDRERMALAKSYDLDGVLPLVQLYKKMYRTHGENMYEILHNNEDLIGIKGQTELETRYLLEDIPYSLVALQSLGIIANVPTPCIDAMITVGRTLVPEMSEGRTIKNLGLDGISKEELIRMCRNKL